MNNSWKLWSTLDVNWGFVDIKPVPHVNVPRKWECNQQQKWVFFSTPWMDQVTKYGPDSERPPSDPSLRNLCVFYHMHDRRKFRSQTSDNMDRWKAELGRGREKRRVEERRSEKRKSQKKADEDARKGRKVAKHCVFPMIWGSGGSKSRLAKAAGAEPAGQMRDEKLHAVVARSTFPFKMYKTHHVRTTFGSWDVEKVHAVVARSTFPSKTVQNTPFSDHFWKLRCQKSARRCGAKHISKSKW